MSQVKLEAQVRETTGKGAARKMRRGGRVPAVLYGPHLEQNILLDVDSKQMEQLLHTAGRTAVINIALDKGAPQTAMLADYQRDVFGTRLLHVDFKQVRMDEKVHASVPIRLVGNSKGVKGGGVLEQMLREVMVEALPMDIPEHLEIDITDLDMGEHLTVADLAGSETMTVLAEKDEMLAVIHTPRAVTERAAESATP